MASREIRSTRTRWTLSAIALCAANRFEQCLQTRLRLMQLHPEFDGINSSVGIARLYLGQFAAALEAMQREPNEDYRLRGLAMVYSALGRRTESDAALNSLTEKFASSDPYGIAAVHAYRGEIDDAFRWLDRAYREHDFGMLDLKTDPLLRKSARRPEVPGIAEPHEVDRPVAAGTSRMSRFESLSSSIKNEELQSWHRTKVPKKAKSQRKRRKAKSALKLSRARASRGGETAEAQSGRNHHPGGIGDSGLEEVERVRPESG